MCPFSTGYRCSATDAVRSGLTWHWQRPELTLAAHPSSDQPDGFAPGQQPRGRACQRNACYEAPGYWRAFITGFARRVEGLQQSSNLQRDACVGKTTANRASKSPSPAPGYSCAAACTAFGLAYRNLLQQPLVALTEDTDERGARQQGPPGPHTCVHSGLMVTTVHVEYTTTLCCRDGSGGECRRPAVSLLSRAGCLSGRHSVSILSKCRKPALCALPCGRRDLFRSAAAGQAKGAPNAGHTTLISPLKRLAARGETVSCPVQLNDL